ncbi:hypothetical protein ACSRDC_16245, partial [Acinetobacter baumannii]
IFHEIYIEAVFTFARGLILGNTPRFSILLMAMYVRFSNAAALDRPPTASKAYLMGFKVKSPF